MVGSANKQLLRSCICKILVVAHPAESQAVVDAAALLAWCSTHSVAEEYQGVQDFHGLADKYCVDVKVVFQNPWEYALLS